MKREELLKAVTSTIIGVDKSGSQTGMDFLIFDKKWIRSFNDILSVSHPIETGIMGAFKAHELLKILDKMEGENVKVSIEKDQLVIKDINTTLKMTQMEDETLSMLKERLTSLDTDDLKWSKTPKNFMEGLKICLFSAGTAPELGVLAGVAFDNDYMIATDNFRITVYTLDKSLGKESFILPTEVVGGLTKFDSFENFSITEAWVHFKDSSGLIVSARRLLGEYPSKKMNEIFDDNFPEEKKPKIYTLPDGLDKAIEKAEILAGKGENIDFDFASQISLKKEGKYLIVSGEKVFGRVEEKVLLNDEKTMPEGIELKTSPTFLKKIIGLSNEFRLSPNNTQVLFKGKNFKHLMVCLIEK